ncbi:MAG: hypothetical protein IH845_01925 [Nanoarchaeota archaeon]|nr:hypothetical protein [Nanoarchaeota archaeon]
MENMDTNDLEGAIDSAKESTRKEETKMTPEEEKGFHKGALNTLTAERSELIKMIGNVEAIMKAHMNRLRELGVEFK